MVARRHDDDGRVDRLLRGRGRFLADLTPRDAAVAVFVRSPVAHGTLRRLEVAPARAAPGVLDVITGDDLAGEGVGPLPCLVEDLVSGDGTPLRAPPRTVLAIGRVRHVGEPLAMIVASSLEQAKDAAERVEVEIEPLPPAVGAEAALAPGAARIWDDVPGNLALDWRSGDPDGAGAALAAAAHRVRVRLRNNRLAIAPLETRGALGIFEPASGRYTLGTPSQGVHRIRTLAARVLGVEPGAVRVMTSDVGGSFGLKAMGFPEQPLVLLAARRTGRPVLWLAERTEAFVTDHAARDHVTEVTLGLDQTARIRAVRFDTIADMGAHLSTMAPRIATLVYARVPSGVYAIDHVDMRVRCAFTNTPPVDAYRGAGVPEAIYALERAIDVAAFELGLDPVALRRRNLLDQRALPKPTPAGYAIDSGAFEAVLDHALQAADWTGFAARRAAAERRGLRRGRGIACYVHGTGGAASETVRLTARPDGRLVLMSGAQDSGQGHAAALARLAGEALGIAPGRIELAQGDSDLLPQGAGTGGSGSLVIGGQVIAHAAARLIDTARVEAARQLEVAATDLAYAEGAFRIVGTDRRIALGEVAAALPEGACCGEADFDGDHRTYPNGVYVAEVLVDPATGRVRLDAFSAVDDLGRIVDSAGADGQIAGGIAQGVGQALLEHDVYDPASGQPSSGSFLDYALPRAGDLPPFRLEKHPSPAPSNPTGIKGAGESGAIGAPPAVIGAVCDALGLAHLDMPATPEAVWRTLHAKSG